MTEKKELTKEQKSALEALKSKLELGYEQSLREIENESCCMDYTKL